MAIHYVPLRPQTARPSRSQVPGRNRLHDNRRGDLPVPSWREGDRRSSLLHQQSGHGRDAVRPGRQRSLGYRKQLPLGPRHDVSGGRVTDPRTNASGEPCLAQPLHFVTPETVSRPSEPRHETSQLWLERIINAGSHYRRNGLVCAGPGSSASSATKRPSPSPGPEGFCARLGVALFKYQSSPILIRPIVDLSIGGLRLYRLCRPGRNFAAPCTRLKS